MVILREIQTMARFPETGKRKLIEVEVQPVVKKLRLDEEVETHLDEVRKDLQKIENAKLHADGINAQILNNLSNELREEINELENAQNEENESEYEFDVESDEDFDKESDEGSEQESDEESENENINEEYLVFQVDSDFQSATNLVPTKIGKRTTLFASASKYTEGFNTTWNVFKLIPDLKIQGLQSKVEAAAGLRKFKVTCVELAVRQDVERDNKQVYITVTVEFED
ncbi:ORF7 [Lymantria xylina nucleopolyhedrovirus]|uniref:ORF7 n=1 Tax=Lymantria xylina multiple nucleopolyhedrovirus TaxID=2847840 RepID=D4N244_9ABAC|nr:ORF7 [Lymantria xylina nucleopolyhedrovirus]ADD73716.1 ORF7 [Lymantria xylina nucleopolyhedrovirus]